MRNSENYEIDDDDDEESRAFYGDEYYSNMNTSEVYQFDHCSTI